MLYTYTTAYLPVLNFTASLYTPSVFNEVNLLKALMIFLSTVVVELLLHTKPKSVEQMMTEEENNLVTNSSSYTVVATKELSEFEFEDFSNNLSSSYPWLKELYNVEDNSGVFNCIEVTGGKDYSILVDPSGYDYARYAAINGTPEEVSDESNLENNEVVEDNE